MRYYISYEEENDLKECLYGNPSLPKFFAINQLCMIPPPTGTLWLCGTSVYSILPSQFNGRCTLVYVLPAIRENTHSTSNSPHLQNSASTNKEGCIPGLTCVQTWWSRTLGALIPSYGVMQALDQVRSLSDSVQKLANDTVLALGNITDTLASHKMMILQNRVALDYILATQGGASTIIGPECCTGLMDPTKNLNNIQQDILDLSVQEELLITMRFLISLCVIYDLCSELNCTEDEWCGEKNGVYGCLCTENQTRPDYLDFSETCESSSGSMSVSRCQLFEAGFPADVLHLNDLNCKGTIRNGRVEFHFDNDEHICGANQQANGTHFIYSNFILGTPRSEGLISREKILKLSFSCVYPQTQTFSMNAEINPLESIVHETLPAGEGRYQVRMTPYEDDEFTRPFTGRVDAELDQKMNVEVRVEGVDSRQFALVMDTCWATPVNGLRWDLIVRGCPNPNDGVSTSSRFSFRMFIFTENSTKLYLHCAVHLCLLSSTRCSTVQEEPLDPTMRFLISLCVSLLLLINESTASSSDPCYDYTTLDEYWRDIRQSPYEYYENDDTLVEWSGWYRLYLNGESAQMSEWCVSHMRCGGETGLYLNDSHPTLEDGVVTLEVMGSNSLWSWDWWWWAPSSQCGDYTSTSIQVKACPGDYYVYEFIKPNISSPVPTYCFFFLCKILS
ncbi:uromodulin-like [Onychostoma macrolepis]|uniref:uromodulin-like n=1 Tax=Onychostoma macrolepis TaxID=369639 RepID=UPI00272CDBD2|nr:uromodulin-like [Onychostoma macrolepis]